MRPGAPRDERALPVLSGVLLFLACPPAAFLLPSFLALAPLLVFIAERPAGPEGRWSATRAGFLTGLVYFGLQLYWLAVALIYYSALAIPAYLLTVLMLTGLTGVFGWAVHFVRERMGLPLALLAAVFWTALEWTQAHLGDLAFPWLGLGTTLAPYPTLAGAADLVGARGLTFWLAAVSGMVATLVVRARAGGARHRSHPSTAALLAWTALLVVVPAAYGFWRAATLDLRPAARVAVVQPNIPEELKLDRRIAVDTSIAALSALTLRLADDGERIDLVAWPEVALPTALGRASGPHRASGLDRTSRLDRASRLADTIAALSARTGAPILAGAYGAATDGTSSAGGDGTAPGDAGTFNSAFLVDAAGLGDGRYDKRRLVPFVERVPFIDPALLRGTVGAILAPDTEEAQRFGTLSRGREAPLLEAGNGARFGVLICYESIFAPLTREYRAAGADFLVNITNDAWYGREPWYARTTALWQHPAHMVLRAIETRTGIARAANTGISMFIDPLGRTHQRTPLFEADVRVETVLTSDGVTGFVRWGDWVGWGAVVSGLLLGVGSAVWPRKGLG